MTHKKIIENLLKKASIAINGSAPYDIQVHNEKFYERVLKKGSLGLGESYMDGWWEVEKLDEFFARLLRNDPRNSMKMDWHTIWLGIQARWLNIQSKKRSLRVAKQHYDLSNKFYEHMLDKRMQYTCAYWKNAKNLEEAQEHKLDLICRKLDLRPEDNVLELGCGWGGFAKYAAEKYGCSVTALNISEEQIKYARESCKGLPVKIIKSDYRDAKGEFDKVASIGLCEHIGYKNYRTFFKIAYQSLKSNGLFLLHTIGRNTSAVVTDPWINKYIFPGGMIPSVKQLGKAMEKLFVMEDWHNFGADYDKTLMSWFKNFDKNWPLFKEQYGERFYCMWKYYLLSCAGTFRARKNQLWQIVLSKGGAAGGYKSIR